MSFNGYKMSKNERSGEESPWDSGRLRGGHARRWGISSPFPAPCKSFFQYFSHDTAPKTRTIARHQRCHELRKKLRAGEVTNPADLVTLNLDIRQFVQDLIASAPADLALAMWNRVGSECRGLEPVAALRQPARHPYRLG